MLIDHVHGWIDVFEDKRAIGRCLGSFPGCLGGCVADPDDLSIRDGYPLTGVFSKKFSAVFRQPGNVRLVHHTRLYRRIAGRARSPLLCFMRQIPVTPLPSALVELASLKSVKGWTLSEPRSADAPVPDAFQARCILPFSPSRPWHRFGPTPRWPSVHGCGTRLRASVGALRYGFFRVRLFPAAMSCLANFRRCWTLSSAAF